MRTVVPEAGLAVDRDVAVRLLDEAVHHAQAKPGALADLLGGEERLEGARQHLRRHAVAVSVTAISDVVARRHFGVRSR